MSRARKAKNTYTVACFFYLPCDKISRLHAIVYRIVSYNRIFFFVVLLCAATTLSDRLSIVGCYFKTAGQNSHH